MANIARLGVVLGIDSAEFVSGIERAEKKLKEFASAALDAGKYAATALVAASAAALRYADEIADVAKANEVTIDSIVKLQNALANSGGKADSAGKLLASFTQTIDKAAEGSFETQKVFKMLGVSLDDLGKLSIDDLFRRTVKELAAMDDPITRNAKAMEFFGKAAKGVDFVELNSQLEKATGLTKAQEEGIKAAAEMYDKFAQAARNVGLTLAAEVGPPLKSTTEFFGKLLGDSKPLIESLSSLFKVITVGAGAGLLLIERLVFGISSLAQLKITNLFSNDTSQKLKEFAQFYKDVYGIKDEKPFSREVSGVISDTQQPTLPAGKPKLRDVIVGVSAEDKKRASDYAAFQKGVDEALYQRHEKIANELKKQEEKDFKDSVEELKKYNKNIDDEIDRTQRQRGQIYLINETERENNAQDRAAQEDLFAKTAAYINEKHLMQSKEYARQKEILELNHRGRDMSAAELQFEKQKLEIQHRQKDAIEAIENAQMSDIDKEMRMQRENELAREALDLARQRLDYSNKEREGTAAEGFMSAAGRAFRDAKTDFEMGQQAFESVIGNMESAILRFVQTGKFSFKDLARSIIADLIAMQVRAQALSIFKMILSAFAPTPGPVGAEEYMYNPPGRAAGGPVGADTMYMVGERGPELFVPQSAGTIIPNNSMASMMAGGQTVNYNGPVIQNMSAIDTQSGIQFLAKNKNTIWAANQSAQRSLPMSR